MANYSKVMTADGLLRPNEGTLVGIFCSAAASTPTLKLWDSLDASGTVLIDTFTPVAGTMYFFGDEGIAWTKGLYVDIGNTVTVTIIYR